MKQNNPYAVEIQFELSGQTSLPESLESDLAAAAAAALAYEQVRPPAGLTVLLTDDEELRRLNHVFRGYDEPTDVLSFPEMLELPGEGRYLGDIAISLETAARQAAEQGHALLDELRLLTVHGVLHLLGHDHAEPDEKTSMWAAQEAILQQLSATS